MLHRIESGRVIKEKNMPCCYVDSFDLELERLHSHRSILANCPAQNLTNQPSNKSCFITDLKPQDRLIKFLYHLAKVTLCQFEFESFMYSSCVLRSKIKWSIDFFSFVKNMIKKMFIANGLLRLVKNAEGWISLKNTCFNIFGCATVCQNWKKIEKAADPYIYVWN